MTWNLAILATFFRTIENHRLEFCLHHVGVLKKNSFQ